MFRVCGPSSEGFFLRDVEGFKMSARVSVSVVFQSLFLREGSTMRACILVCAATIAVLGFGGVALADLAVVDHFDGASLNTSLWSQYSTGTISLANSIVTVANAGSTWGDLETAFNYAATTGTAFEFQYEGRTGDGFFGLYQAGNQSVNFRPHGSGWRLEVDATDFGTSSVSLSPGDIVDLVQTATNWQAYVNSGLAAVRRTYRHDRQLRLRSFCCTQWRQHLP